MKKANSLQTNCLKKIGKAIRIGWGGGEGEGGGGGRRGDRFMQNRGSGICVCTIPTRR